MAKTPLAIGLAVMYLALGAQADREEAPPALQVEGSEPRTGTLEIHVILVGADLDLKPVPKRRFIVRREDGSQQTVTTGFSGKASLAVVHGRHSVLSEDALDFEGKRFSWDVEVEVLPGRTTILELSNDNATIEDAGPTTVHLPITDEGVLYKKFKSSVFKIISASGHGSGFLVSNDGLVLTNHHVVQGSDYLAVKCDATKKYPALLVAEDSANDLAVLQVHPDVVHGFPALTLAPDEAELPTVSVGERIVAIGSPLVTEGILTSGIVSKIERGVIYSDVNINPGNSGGPSFSMLGQVIGVNTFGLPGGTGPGVSGIVRIHLARPLLEKAIEISRSQAPPPRQRLPVAPSYRFPPQDLHQAALTRGLNPLDYHLEAGKLDVQFITPPLVAYLESRAEREAAEGRKRRTKKKKDIKEYKPGADFYEWRRYAGDYRPVVRVHVMPEIKMTGGSAFAVAMLGSNVPVRYRFKTDFARMELRRDLTVVEPIHPGRQTHVVNIKGQVNMTDVGFYGVYEYPPEAFKPGVPVRLCIWQEGETTPTIHTIKPSQVRRIWDDFDAYYRSLGTVVADGAQVDTATAHLEGSEAVVSDYLARNPAWHSVTEILSHVPVLRSDFNQVIKRLIDRGVVERSTHSPIRYRRVRQR